MKKINSRAKGQRFERDTARFFQRWWPKARRQTQDQARDGAETPDIKGTPFWIECKHYGRRITFNMILAWVLKADKEAPSSKDYFGSSFIIRYKETRESAMYAMPNKCLLWLEMMADYCERPIDMSGHYDFAYNIPEQYMSDLLDFAYGVKE